MFIILEKKIMSIFKGAYCSAKNEVKADELQVPDNGDQKKF